MGFGLKVYNAFKPIIEPIFLPFFRDVEPILKKAGINKDLREFVGEAFFYSIAISVIFAFMGFAVGLALTMLMKNPKIIFVGIVLALVGGLIGFVMGIMFFRAYPSLMISARGKKIDNSLYLATIYMATISTSGANPLSLFTLLAKYKEFSEISKDAQDIVRYVKGLGLDLPTALHVKASQSPSREWRELLEGLRSILVEGGDMESYLYEKARQYIQEFKRKLVEYTNVMQVILELYITLIIVGVVFVMILTTIMGSIMGGGSKMMSQIQLLIVVVFLPAATLMFVFLLKAMNPFEA
jgi:flagellar protein FlaJ